jgi:hypothetical protein
MGPHRAHAQRQSRAQHPRDARHQRALAQTTAWARAAADAGDYVDALSWLRVLEVVEGHLLPDMRVLKEQCVSSLTATAPARAR